jgi:hypothetical protein
MELTTSQIGKTVQINVTVTNVTNLWQWGISLSWNSTILNFTSITEGPFLSSIGTTMAAFPENAYDEYFSKGILPEASSTFISNKSASGSGILATITFDVLAVGETDLTIESTLKRPESGHPLIDHTSTNGHIVVRQATQETPTPSPEPSTSSPKPSTTPIPSHTAAPSSSAELSPSPQATESATPSHAQASSPSPSEHSTPTATPSQSTIPVSSEQNQPAELYIMAGAGVVVAAVVVAAIFMQRKPK